MVSELGGLLVRLFVCGLWFGRSVSWFVGQSVGMSVDHSVIILSVSGFVSWSAVSVVLSLGLSIFRSVLLFVGLSVSRPVGLSVCHSISRQLVSVLYFDIIIFLNECWCYCYLFVKSPTQAQEAFFWFFLVLVVQETTRTRFFVSSWSPG